MLGRASGRGDKASYQWARPSKFRSAGDIPSAKVMRRLLEYSDERGLGLSAEHLVKGASVVEVDRILKQRGDLSGVAAE